MTRTTITPTAFTANAANAPVTTSVAALVAPGALIAAPSGGQRLLLVLINSAGSDKTATIVAGADEFDSPSGPAWMQDQGDLVATVLANSAAAKYIGPLDSARFAQSDGYVYVNFQSGFTGTIEAYTWPAGY